MTTTEIAANVYCASCGSDLFKHPADPKPDDMVTCNGCSAEWRYADLQSSAKDKALEAVTDALRDIFKGTGFK